MRYYIYKNTFLQGKSCMNKFETKKEVLTFLFMVLFFLTMTIFNIFLLLTFCVWRGRFKLFFEIVI